MLTLMLAFTIMPLRAEVRQEHVMAPMRDGTKLSAYLYLPDGPGPWPVLMEQRYADLTAAGTRKQLADIASHGYVVAAANFRGTHRSEGQWVGYRALGWGEQKDGYDLVEWLATQPWSNGKIGTFGGSQAGFAQNFLAVTQPPHLVCQYMMDTGLSLFHEGYRIGGAAKPDRFKTMDAVCRVKDHNRLLMEEWFRHPTFDAYWADEDCNRFIDRMNVPCFTIGSWYDFMCRGSVESFVGRQHRGGPNSRGKQQLIIGPWLHGNFNKSNKIGQMTYPENARFDAIAHMIRWFDHYLKGIDNGIDRDPAVKYYVMGPTDQADGLGNVWRTATDWPPKVQMTSYFLCEDLLLSTSAPAQAKSVTTWKSDPKQPMSIPARGFPGAADARDFEKQEQVRTFTTPPLTAPIEWTGLVEAELWVSTTTPDSDFIVRISDVYPDGRSILIIDMIRRGRYRDGFEKEVFFTPGQPTKVAFPIGWLSQIFGVGHRIRVTLASTGAPFYEPNPNTDRPITIAFPADVLTADIAVMHQTSHASRILAPVLVNPTP